MILPNLDLSRIDDAMARGDVVDPRAWNWIDAILAPIRAIPQVRLSSIKAIETATAPTQRDIEDVAIVSAVIVSAANDEPTVSAALIPDAIFAQDGGMLLPTDNGGGDDAPTDDKMEWLSAYANNAADDPTSSYVPDVSIVNVASAPVSTLTPSTKAIERLMSTYSWQKQLAWEWITRHYGRIESEKLSGRKLAEAINADHDKKRKISHETARTVLKDYRWQFFGM
jgi:hypothetical protein